MRTTMLFAILLIGAIPAIVFGQNQDALRKKHFNLNDNIAIDGFDPVAYFKINKAVKGKKNFALNSHGVTYYFSSAENREEFKQNSSRYEPEYGGWCAYAMGAKGEKVSIDPETFKIVDGKLYLFYNKFFNNTLTSWNRDEAHLKTAANDNWSKIYH